MKNMLCPDDITRAALTQRRQATRGEGFLVSWSRSTSASSIYRYLLHRLLCPLPLPLPLPSAFSLQRALWFERGGVRFVQSGYFQIVCLSLSHFYLDVSYFLSILMWIFILEIYCCALNYKNLKKFSKLFKNSNACAKYLQAQLQVLCTYFWLLKLSLTIFQLEKFKRQNNYG